MANEPVNGQAPSGLEIAGELRQLPEGYMPPEQFAQLPKEARHRIISEYAGRQKAEREMENWKQAATQAQQRPPQMQAQQPSAAPLVPQDPFGVTGKSEDHLRGLKRQMIGAMQKASVNPTDEALRTTVSDPGFPALMEAIDNELFGRQSRSAAQAAVAPLQTHAALSQTASAMYERLKQRHDPSQVFDPESPLTKRAIEIRDVELTSRGVNPEDPGQAPLVAALTELAYANADRELNRAGAGGAPRRRLEVEGPGSAVRSSMPEADEISALLQQGRKLEAHALAKKAMYEGKGVHSTFDASARATA